MRLADLVEKHADELAALESLNNGTWMPCFSLILFFGLDVRNRGKTDNANTGKSVVMARNVDVLQAAETFRWIRISLLVLFGGLLTFRSLFF